MPWGSFLLKYSVATAVLPSSLFFILTSYLFCEYVCLVAAVLSAAKSSYAISNAFILEASSASIRASFIALLDAKADSNCGVAAVVDCPSISSAPPTPPCKDLPDINPPKKVRADGVSNSRLLIGSLSPLIPWIISKYSLYDFCKPLSGGLLAISFKAFCIFILLKYFVMLFWAFSNLSVSGKSGFASDASRSFWTKAVSPLRTLPPLAYPRIGTRPDVMPTPREDTEPPLLNSLRLSTAIISSN